MDVVLHNNIFVGRWRGIFWLCTCTWSFVAILFAFFISFQLFWSPANVFQPLRSPVPFLSLGSSFSLLHWQDAIGKFKNVS